MFAFWWVTFIKIYVLVICGGFCIPVGFLLLVQVLNFCKGKTTNERFAKTSEH